MIYQTNDVKLVEVDRLDKLNIRQKDTNINEFYLETINDNFKMLN